MRKEGEYKDSRHQVKLYGQKKLMKISAEEILQLCHSNRDGFNHAKPIIIDPFDGQEDLRNKF